MALSRKNGLVVVKNTISNTEVNLIYITEDKLRIILMRHESNMKQTHDWISASGFLISSIAAFFASGFYDLSAVDIVMKTIFGGLSLFSLYYLIHTICNLKVKKGAIESIIQDIKAGKSTS